MQSTALSKAESLGAKSSMKSFRKETQMLTCHEAVGAVIGHFVVVAALVEHAADHMYPRTTRVALHPPLLLLIVILPFLQLTLAHLQLQQKHKAWANSSCH